MPGGLVASVAKVAKQEKTMPSTYEPQPLGYRVPEVARMLRVPSRSVYRWVAEGRLKGLRIGRIVVVLRSDLERFLAEHRISTDSSRTKSRDVVAGETV